MRIPFNQYALYLAKIAALRSEDPDTQVGCCILNKDNRILSLGYNGLLPGKAYDKSWTRDDKLRYMIHAEQNALSMIHRYDNPHTIACTISPCGACAREIASYGIKNVLYMKEYHRCDMFKDIFDEFDISYKEVSIDIHLEND